MHGIADLAAQIVRAALPTKRITIGPWKGSMRSIPADRVPLDYLAGGTDFLYLPRSGYWRRRKGQTQKFDTFASPVGMLPAKWSGKARQLEEYVSGFVSDGIPTVMALVTRETVSTGIDDGRFSQVWFRDQVADANATVGSEFSSTSYPDPGSEQFYKFVPLWHKSGDGGITRGVTEFQRRLFFNGSRSFKKVGNWHYFPSILGTPSRCKLGASTGTASAAQSLLAISSSAGGWTAHGAASIHAATSETTASDAEYMAEDAGSSAAVLVLGTGTDPGVDTGHVINIRYKNPHPSNVIGDFQIILANSVAAGGATVKQIDILSIAADGPWIDYSVTLTTGEAALIASYLGLRMSFTTAATSTIQVSWFNLALPAVGGYPDRLIPSGPLPPTHAGTLAAGNMIESNAYLASPDGTTSRGIWTDQLSGTTNIHTRIDETTYDDTDYITTPDNTTDTTYKASLGDPGIVPTVDDTITLRFRAREAGSGGSTLSVFLYDGGTQIASMVVPTPLPTPNFVTYELTLTPAQISAVSPTGWANLDAWFAKGDNGSNGAAQISWAQLQISSFGATRGGWSGYDKFYYSVAYRFEDDSIWAACVPRGPNATLASGYNLFQINASNLAASYESVVWSNIPVGPDGTKSRILLRSPKIDARTESTLQLDPTDLRVVWEIKDNTTTTYTDTYADDDSLTLDPDELLIRDDHLMTPRSRYFIAGDVRALVAYSGLNPCAIIFAPVKAATGSGDSSYELNYPDTTASIFNNSASYYRITNASGVNDQLRLSIDTGSATTNKDFTITASTTLEQLVDSINATLFSVDSVQWRAQICPGANPQALAATALTPTSRAIASCTVSGQTATVASDALGDVAVGDFITGTGADTGVSTPYVSVINSSSSSSSTITFVGTITSGSKTLTFVKNTGDNVFGGTDYAGYVRVIANSLPGFLYFNSTYLDQFPVQKSSVFMTVASPGAVKCAPNCWSGKISNEHNPPAEAGISMGGFAVDNGFVVPFANKSAVIRNTRDSGTGVDSDYKLQIMNEARGCCAWQSVTGGNRSGAFFSPEGWIASDLYSETLISEAVYHHAKSDAVSGTGGVGDYAYEVQQCIGATAADTDTAYLIGRIMRGALWVNYRNSSSVTRPDRQVVYDFSEGRTDPTRGLTTMLRSDLSPWGWSLPLVRPFTAMTEGRRSDGTHLYGWNDANAGSTGDGRIDEFETSDTDNGTAISASLQTGWLRGPHHISVQEIVSHHSTPAAATVALKFVRGVTAVVTGDSYTMTPSTSSTLVAIRDVKMLTLPARVGSAACYIEWDQTAGGASELRGWEALVKEVPAYK